MRKMLQSRAYGKGHAAWNYQERKLDLSSLSHMICTVQMAEPVNNQSRLYDSNFTRKT